MRLRLPQGRAAWLIAPTLVAIAWFCAPIVFGGRTLFLRDVLNTHLLLRESLGVALRAGELPLIDPLRLSGAPLAGNMNAVPFYPGNLVLLFADTLWQLNLHFAVHWLLAFAGAYRLGRGWGLGAEGAAACGAAFALSGYWFSQMNLFNAVAGVALAPWLWFLLTTGGPDGTGRRRIAGAGLVWGLALLGGDPILAVVALGPGLLLAATRHGRAYPWLRLVLALGLGTLIAAPQLVETARIFAISYRGVFGFPVTHSGTRTPSTVVDLLIPFFFGRPDLLGLWGKPLFGGYEMLYFTLFPGLVPLALALAAGRPRRRESVLLAALAGIVLVLMHSGGTAIPAWIARLPGASAFRYYEKLAMIPMLALALAAGAGIQRLARDGAIRPLARAAGLLSLPMFALWLGFGAGGARAERLFEAAYAAAGDAPAWQDGRLRWAGLAMFGCLTLALMLGAAVLLRRRGVAASGAILVLHAVVQSLLLAPLVPTDDAAAYRAPPALANRIPRGKVLVQQGAIEPAQPLRPGELPERRHLWLSRRLYAELSGFSAVRDGRQIELAVSPEGLDPFVTQVLISAFDRFSDARRIAVLRATGVEVLPLSRALVPEDAGGARLVSVEPSIGRSLWIYEIPDPLPEAVLAGSVRRVPHVNAALEAIWSPGFDPARVALVPGEGPPRSAPPGTARIVATSRQRVVVTADSAAGGVLVLRRAYLPIWKATLDGRPAPTTIAQITRLAVEVPPGRHTVELFVSRGPLVASLVVAGLALLGLVLTWQSEARADAGSHGPEPDLASTPVAP